MLQQFKWQKIIAVACSKKQTMPEESSKEVRHNSSSHAIPWKGCLLPYQPENPNNLSYKKQIDRWNYYKRRFRYSLCLLCHRVFILHTLLSAVSDNVTVFIAEMRASESNVSKCPRTTIRLITIHPRKHYSLFSKL